MRAVISSKRIFTGGLVVVAAAIVVTWWNAASRPAAGNSSPVIAQGRAALRPDATVTTKADSEAPPKSDDAETRRAKDEALAVEAQAIAAEPKRDNPGRFARLNELATRWLQHDPAGALRFLAGLSDIERRRAGQAAFKAWFESDAVGALAFVKSAVTRDETVGDYLEPIFEGLAFEGAELRLGRLQEFLAALPATARVYAGMDTLFIRAATRDPEAAAAFGATLAEPKARAALFLYIGMQNAQRRGMSVVTELMARPSLNADEQQQVAGALTKLVRTQFRDVVDWVKTQPPAEMFNPVRGAIVQQYEPTDPETAVRTAAQMVGEERNVRLKGLLASWLERDFARAEAWALASDLPPADIAEAIVRAQAALAPKPFVDYASRVAAAWQAPDQKAGRRQLFGDLPAWLEQDRAAALKWIEANTRSEDDRRFFDMMIRRVPLEKPAPPKPGEFWHN